MKTAEILSVTDRTSWSRIYMVFRYFWLRIRWKVAAFMVISALLGVQARNTGLLAAPSQISTFALSLAILLSPIMLVKRNDGPLLATLPALGWEKCVAIFSICLVIVPVALSLPYNLIVADMSKALMTTMLPAGFEISMPLAYVCSILSNCMLISACLWGAMRAKRSRALYGVLWLLLSFLIMFVGITLIGFGLGIVFAMQSESPDTILHAQSSVVGIVMKAFAVEVLIGSIVFISLAARAINRKQY